MSPESNPADRDFIRAMVAKDIAADKYARPVMTRFPPEPNGYLHIGHAKAICLNFGVASEFGGVCNLRFDDTNPETEDVRFTESIQSDVRWLGFDWQDRLYFASDYFEALYDFAVKMTRDGNAYVDSLNEEEIRAYRGTVTEAGRNSPYRDRSVDENLDLFARMRAGEFPDGAHVLRARIDMASANMLMRDPLLYRIRHAHHYRQGDDWCIYPFYDFAHGLSDALEGVTHSLCSLEFKDNRELYDWGIRAAGVPMRPEQTEFARLALDYTVLSKRKLIRLVDEGHVDGWDDPRLPTLAGLRRRGVTAEAIRQFCDLIGVARVNSRIDMGKLEYCIRADLNLRVPRVMCVLRPLKIVITNYPDDAAEELEASLYPHDVPLEGTRRVPFSREVLIERDDFMEDPEPGFFRLAPGREVRLRYAYYITCTEVIKDRTGAVVELRCTYDPASRGGTSPDGRKVKSTLHWVSASHSVPAEVRLFDRLFSTADPDGSEADFVTVLNPDSKVVLTGARIEPYAAEGGPGTRYQFERQGFFIEDAFDSARDHLVFNRTVTMRDSWARTMAAPADATFGRPERKPLVPPGVPGDRPGRDAAQEARYRALMDNRGLADGDADTLARHEPLAGFFDGLAGLADPLVAANWVVNELAGALKGADPSATAVTPESFAVLIRMVGEGRISRAVGRDLLAELVAKGGDPEEMVRARGLEQVADPGAINDLIMKVMHANPDRVQAFRNGKRGLAGFFVGQVMREGDGRLDPKVVKALVEDALG